MSEMYKYEFTPTVVITAVSLDAANRVRRRLMDMLSDEVGDEVFVVRGSMMHLRYRPDPLSAAAVSVGGGGEEK
jgi:hypothetical protein